MKSAPDDQVRLDWAVSIAREAGQSTLDHFRRSGLKVERKADGSPVTIADRAAEELLRKRIAEKFPSDAVLGEEFGETGGTSGYQWVLDPIDGTKSFVHGVPLYSTLVAVLADGEPRIGVICAPAAGELVFAASGSGCWHVDERSAQAGPQPARVSRTAKLQDALVLTSELGTFSRERAADALPAFVDVARRARLACTWGDAFGYLLVATGRADVMIDPVMNVWDLAALVPIIEEAGGRFCNWQGRRSIDSNDSLATNGLLTDEVLAILGQHESSGPQRRLEGHRGAE